MFGILKTANVKLHLMINMFVKLYVKCYVKIAENITEISLLYSILILTNRVGIHLI